MKKLFVPHKLALELKKLGFNEKPCIANWIKRDKRDGGGIVLEICGDVDTEYKVLDEWSAPIFSQAFKFFIDKYKFTFYIHILDALLDKCETYEEAELNCLKILIKLAKEK